MSDIDPSCDYVHQPSSEPEPPAPVEYEEVTVTLRWRVPAGTRYRYPIPVSVHGVADIVRSLYDHHDPPFMGRLEVTGHDGGRTVYTVGA